MKFQFIDDHRDEFSICRMGEVLDVSPGGYYAWRGRPPSAREMANRELVKKIEAMYNESGETYGSPRLYCQLQAPGVACGENRGGALDALATSADQAGPALQDHDQS